MFATPVSVPSHETLATRVFGRFLAPHAQASGAPVPAAAPAPHAPVTEDDGLPDLAQRVREVGEW